MTFSIAGRCARTGQFGVAVSSSSVAVGARVPYLRAGVGAVCVQSAADPRLGSTLLDLLQDGSSPEDALRRVEDQDSEIQWRQLAAINRAGKPAAFSGTMSLGVNASATGPDGVAAGNLLADAKVPDAIMTAFSAEPDRELGDRLVAGLEAGLAAGGEAGPVHSAAMLVVDDVPWLVTDLRVDWAEDDPIGKLRELWTAWLPQRDDYRLRALEPASAPGFGVPGDPRPT